MYDVLDVRCVTCRRDPNLCRVPTGCTNTGWTAGAIQRYSNREQERTRENKREQERTGLWTFFSSPSTSRFPVTAARYHDTDRPALHESDRDRYVGARTTPSSALVLTRPHSFSLNLTHSHSSSPRRRGGRWRAGCIDRRHVRHVRGHQVQSAWPVQDSIHRKDNGELGGGVWSVPGRRQPFALWAAVGMNGLHIHYVTCTLTHGMRWQDICGEVMHCTR